MNRKQELAKNTIVLTIGNMSTKIVSFLLVPLYTALLMPEEYGVVDLFNTYIVLLVPLITWQLENGLFRFMLDDRNNMERNKTIISTVLLANIGQTVLFCLVYSVLSRFMSSRYKIFLLIDVILNIFQVTLCQALRGLGHNTKYAVSSFISSSAVVVFNVIFIAGLHMGAYGMFIGSALAKAMTIVYLIGAAKIWEYFDIRKFDCALFKKMIAYSAPLVPNQLSWWIVGVSDRTIISSVLGLAANGLYTIANKFSSIYILFYNIFNISWTESVSLHLKDVDGEQYVTETINQMFNLFAGTCFGIIACMPFVFPVFINANYADAYSQIPILMIAVLCQVVVGLYSAIYTALKKSVEIAKTSFFAAVINLGINILLIKSLGLYAASASTLLAYASMAVYRYFHLKRYVNVPLHTKTLMLSWAVCAIVVGTYYSGKTFFYVIGFITAAVYAVAVNKNFLLDILRTAKMFLDKFWRKVRG